MKVVESCSVIACHLCRSSHHFLSLQVDGKVARTIQRSSPIFSCKKDLFCHFNGGTRYFGSLSLARQGQACAGGE